ncbi:hypothetical protein F5878DRAFT_618751 [Lentinula raphanica]|uniref:C2H2-type domain-containing protein n=1 Tax=Lentinula raphanica TaxID=153919 RepID=A0AA38P9D7_9AGAR|nr:hypothetical protein F5878DRAFT_618751 [Lentinula raphanica]
MTRWNSLFKLALVCVVLVQMGVASPVPGSGVLLARDDDSDNNSTSHGDDFCVECINRIVSYPGKSEHHTSEHKVALA